MNRHKSQNEQTDALSEARTFIDAETCTKELIVKPGAIYSTLPSKHWSDGGVINSNLIMRWTAR